MLLMPLWSMEKLRLDDHIKKLETSLTRKSEYSLGPLAYLSSVVEYSIRDILVYPIRPA
jgi:hypothetical protein